SEEDADRALAMLTARHMKAWRLGVVRSAGGGAPRKGGHRGGAKGASGATPGNRPCPAATAQHEKRGRYARVERGRGEKNTARARPGLLGRGLRPHEAGTSSGGRSSRPTRHRARSTRPAAELQKVLAADAPDPFPEPGTSVGELPWLA